MKNSNVKKTPLSESRIKLVKTKVLSSENILETYEVYSDFIREYSKQLNDVMTKEGWGDDARYYSNQITYYSNKTASLDSLLEEMEFMEMCK